MRPDSSIHWSAYPALLTAGAFAIGILGDASVAITSPPSWLGGFAIGLLTFAGVEWWDRRELVTLAPLGRFVAVLLMVVCAGGARHAAYQAPSPRALSALAAASDESVALRGEIQNAPGRAEEATRFTLNVEEVFGEQDTTSIDGQARVTLRTPPWSEEDGDFPDLFQGDVVQLQGPLRPAPGLRNPGGFDYAAYLERRGTCCTMFVDDPEDVRVLSNRRGWRTTGIVTLRRYVRAQIRQFVPSAEAQAVLQALLLGDRSRISDTQRDRFAQTGLMHLLAVSGLHVFLVGMVLYVLLRPLLMRFRLGWRTVEVARALLTIAVLGAYMLLTGARPSVVRAVVMGSLFIGGVVFQRSAHSLNTLGVAALILLAVRPTALFDVGFQLSMAAVAAIVTLSPRFMEAVPERYRTSEAAKNVVSLGTASAAAILGTAPVLLYHFGWVSGAGLLLNVVGIPCTGLALASALAAVGLGGVWTLAGKAFGSASDLFVEGLLATSRYGASWFSWAGIRMETPDPLLLGALIVGIVALVQWPRPRLRWRCVVVSLLFVTFSIWGSTVGRDAAPTLDVIFFDVGHGDATLVSTPNGRHVLVDAGPQSPFGDAGASVIMPFLERRGIRHLDAVVITHPDEDHLGGVPTIVEEVSVGRVLHSGQVDDTRLFKETRGLLDRLEISNQALGRGDTLGLDSALRVQVLNPPGENGRRFDGKNDASVVLHVAYGKVDVLLSGDVEEDAERDLVRAYGEQLASRVVKVPHHGSSTSSTPPLVCASIDSIGKTRAVVSADRDGRYGLPSEEVLSRWMSGGAQIHTTMREGAVWIRSDGEAVWEVQWK